MMKRDNLQIVREFSGSYNRHTKRLQLTTTTDISEGSVIKVAWHPRINQIFATTSLGEVHVMYSPVSSSKGAMLAANRSQKIRRAVDDWSPVEQPVITPHALPMYKDEHYDVSDAGTAAKRKRENVRNNALKTRKPEPPVRGPGSGGRVGEAADRHVIMGMIKGDIRSEDPREALLKYAAKEGDKTWTKGGYKDCAMLIVLADPIVRQRGAKIRRRKMLVNVCWHR